MLVAIAAMVQDPTSIDPYIPEYFREGSAEWDFEPGQSKATSWKRWNNINFWAVQFVFDLAVRPRQGKNIWF